MDYITVKELFADAEKALKIVERYEDEGLVVPAVNELRYAGYHIVRAATSENEKDTEDQLHRAAKHCKRAQYDAFEVAILNHLEVIALFERDYRLVQITPVIPNYIDLRKTARNSSNRINNIDRESRDDYYKECESMLKDLESVVETMEDARPELNKSLKRIRLSALSAIVMIIIGAVGLVIA